ncbi:MAG: Ig-like domain-containing protein, partial [Acetatifactor sp.]|nr:Ig-like domain-containing protein [Acetatifactor sp.]
MVTYREERASLLAYTRDPSQENYPDGLAYSVHFAYSRAGACYHALHQNYGILFAEAEISAEDTIMPRGVKNPRLFRLSEGQYGILADRTGEDGSSEAYALLWKTRDFREFDKPVLLEKRGPEWEALWEAAGESGQESCVVDGEQVTGSRIEISSTFCDRIVQRWTQVHNIEISLPDEVYASKAEDLEAVSARAVYSDGSTVPKKVLWNTEEIDFSVPGTYQVTGKVCSRKYAFPLLKGYGDPVIFAWEGKWYFLGTNDNLNDIGIYVREADSVEALFAEGAEEHLILGVDEERG